MDFVDTFVGKYNGAQARRGVRGRGVPTIIIIKEIIRFNNNEDDDYYYYDYYYDNDYDYDYDDDDDYGHDS